MSYYIRDSQLCQQHSVSLLVYYFLSKRIEGNQYSRRRFCTFARRIGIVDIAIE